MENILTDEKNISEYNDTLRFRGVCFDGNNRLWGHIKDSHKKITFSLCFFPDNFRLEGDYEAEFLHCYATRLDLHVKKVKFIGLNNSQNILEHLSSSRFKHIYQKFTNTNIFCEIHLNDSTTKAIEEIYFLHSKCSCYAMLFNESPTYFNSVETEFCTLSFDSCIFSEFKILSSKTIKRLTLAFISFNSSQTSHGLIDNCEIEQLTIKPFGKIQEQPLHLSNSTFQEVIFNNFLSAQAYVRFIDSQKISNVTCKNTTLTNIEFVRGSWNDSTVFTLENSSLGGVKFDLIGLPKFQILDNSIDKRLEIFRSIRSIAQASDDRIKSLHYYGEEMRAYFLTMTTKQLVRAEETNEQSDSKEEKQSPTNILSRVFSKSIIDSYLFKETQLIFSTIPLKFYKSKWSERLTVWTQLTFSNFGNSWKRPLLHLLFWSTLYSLIMLAKDPQREIVWIWNTTWEDWSRTVTFWTEVINPAHKGEIVFDPDWIDPIKKAGVLNITEAQKGLKVRVAGFADMIFRIFTAFMIFYTLKGLRKYTYK